MELNIEMIVKHVILIYLSNNLDWYKGEAETPNQLRPTPPHPTPHYKHMI